MIKMLSIAVRTSFAVLLSTCVVAMALGATAKKLVCDESLKTAFKPDALTTVVLVKQFKQGEAIVLSEPASPFTPKAANDLCLVKLNVGPGNPGPAGAPSTSPGIGIEVWLPTQANWNGRVHALGGGGWQGGPHGSPSAIGEPRAAMTASIEGAVSSSTDGGHPRPGALPGKPGGKRGGGDFAMNPDGTLSTTLLKDFASRSVHEQAVKTKALATAYYGKAPKYSYWEGSSNGGRQGLNLAQNHPEDFDGIIANMPAINWSSFLAADLYPQIVFQRDLGGIPPTEAQQDLVSNAAIRACDVVGGEHLGYIMDMAACSYDPVKDPEVLCKSEGGKNNSGDCITKLQAQAFNKIWYGLTADGSAPAPAVDNGWNMTLGSVRRWYGMPRGTSLYNMNFSKLFNTNAGVANVTGPFTHAVDGVALALQNPTIAAPNFENATGNGADGWKALSYAQLANSLDRALALQPVLGHIDSNDPDLSGFKARGGKLLTWHGLHDEAIPVQGTIRYYNSVIDKMGLAAVQSFYKLYIVPGVGHATPNGSANAAANPPVVGGSQFYDLLVNWVEHGIAPERVEIESPKATPVKITQPICPFPQRATYKSGDPHVTTSYICL